MLKKLFLVTNLAIITSLILGVLLSPQALAKIDISPYNSNSNLATEKNWFILNAKAGETVSDSFKIKNDASNPVNVNIAAKDSQILDDGAFTILADSESNKNTGNWVQLDVNNLVINSNSFVQIPFKINVPIDTKNGEYAAGVYIMGNPNTDQSVKVSVRKAVRIYIAVGQDFELNSEVSNLNILDPKDSNFEDVKTKKTYFGKNNLLLSFEAENTGNIFGVLEAKYAIKFQNGQVYESTFSTEIAPNVGKRTYYIVTNQAYQVGETEAILDYKIKPQNIDPARVKTEKVSGILSDKLQLTQDELNSFKVSETKFIIDKNEEKISSNETVKSQNNLIDILKITLLITSFSLLAFGVGGWYFIKQRKSKQT